MAKLSVYLFDEIKCVILRIKMHFEQRVRKDENASKQQEMKASVRASLDFKDAWFQVKWLYFNKLPVDTLPLGELYSKCNPTLIELCLCSNVGRCLKYTMYEILS